MKIPILALIFQGIPEQIAVATLAFVIANIPLVWKRIVLIGTVVAVTSYIFRLLPLTFGVHTVLNIGLLFILLVVVGKVNINISLVASLGSFLALIIAETVSVTLQMNMFGITLDDLLANTTTRIRTGLLQVFVVFIIALIFYKTKIFISQTKLNRKSQ